MEDQELQLNETVINYFKLEFKENWQEQINEVLMSFVDGYLKDKSANNAIRKHSQEIEGKTVRFLTDPDGTWVNIEDISAMIDVSRH